MIGNPADDATELARRVEAYLPRGWQVRHDDTGAVYVTGRDRAGWTLDGYVLPRLASGGMYGAEVEDAESIRRHVERENREAQIEMF